MTLVGFTRSGHKFFSGADLLRDLIFTSGILGGIAWGQIIHSARAIRFEFRLAVIAVIALIFSQVGVYFGLITAIESEGRVYEPGQFSSTYFILALAPMIWVTPFGGLKFKKILRRRCTVVIGMVSVALFSLVSATRSVLLLLIVSIGLIIWIVLPRRITAIVFIVTLSAILTCFLSSEFSIDLLQIGFIGERFLRLSDIQSEIRFQEIQDLIGQMSISELLFGKGFGIGFISIVGGEDMQSTVLNPHVGLLAFLQKGGVIIFFGSLAPLVFALWHLSVTNRGSHYMALVAGIIFYFVCGSISGGWYITPFALLGYCMSRVVVLHREGVLAEQRKSRLSL